MRKGPHPPTRDKPSEARRSWAEISPYAWLSIGGFVGSLLFAILLLMYSRLLVSLGMQGLFFFLAVVPMALCVASFLFGALSSVAIYRGTYAGGALELQGSIVAFAGVMIAALYFQRTANFPLTVYVHGSTGQQSLPLRNEGAVLLDLGGDRRREPIGDKGQAFFSEIPANFHGQKVNVALDSSDYERPDNRPLELEGTSIYLEVRRKPLHITGNVVDDETKAPVVGATVSVAGISTKTLEQGRFDLALPSDHVRNDMTISVSADGYQTWSGGVTPRSSPFGVALLR